MSHTGKYNQFLQSQFKSQLVISSSLLLLKWRRCFNIWLGFGVVYMLCCHVVWYSVWNWRGAVWYGIVWNEMVWCGVVWCGVAWYGMVLHGVVWCGIVWCGVVEKGTNIILFFSLTYFQLARSILPLLDQNI